MLLWIVIAAVFLFLLARYLQENSSSTRSRAAALIGTLFDGLGLVALTLGVFGLLVAVVFGVMPDSGPRLAGSGLYSTLTWSIALLAAGALAMVLSIGVRRLGGQGRSVARPVRGR